MIAGMHYDIEAADKLRRALQDLGENQEQVAAALVAGGDKGRREDEQLCPIANYLRRVLDADGVLVYNRSAMCIWDVDVASADLPLPCLLFLGHFDEGGWDELVDDSTRPEGG